MDILRDLGWFIKKVIQKVVAFIRWWSKQYQSLQGNASRGLWVGSSLLILCCMCAVPMAMLTPDAEPDSQKVEVTAVEDEGEAVVMATAEMPEATAVVPTETSIPMVEATPLPTSLPTATATAVPSSTPLPTATATATAVPSSTPLPTATATVVPSSTPLPAATATAVIPRITVNSDAVNVRSGPSTEYPIVVTLYDGDEATATGVNSAGTWVRINLSSGGSGWVSTDLVEVAHATDLTVVTNIAPPPTAVVQATATAVVVSGGDDGGGGGTPFQCTGGCATPPDPSCAIKGNVNSSGERIYHMPGGAYYNRTDIKPEEGDRWFCTEAEAQAAGFRRSQR